MAPAERRGKAQTKLCQPAGIVLRFERERALKEYVAYIGHEHRPIWYLIS